MSLWMCEFHGVSGSTACCSMAGLAQITYVAACTDLERWESRLSDAAYRMREHHRMLDAAEKDHREASEQIAALRAAANPDSKHGL